MKKVTRIITLGSLFFCSHNFAQKNNDIGIQFSSIKQDRFTIDYRFGSREKLKFVIGASIGGQTEKFRPTYIEGDETYELSRSLRNTKKNVNLKFGFNRQLKESFFSFGANVLIGYEYKRVNRHNLYSRKDEDGISWMVYSSGDPEKDYEYVDGITSQPGILGVRNLRTGLFTNLSADIPLGKKLLVNVNGGLYSGLNLFMSSTVHANPLNEFSYDHGVSFYELYFHYGVGLRYIL